MSRRKQAKPQHFQSDPEVASLPRRDGTHGHSYVEQHPCTPRSPALRGWPHDISRRQSCQVPRNVPEGFGGQVRKRGSFQFLESVCSSALQRAGHEGQRDLSHSERRRPSRSWQPGQREQLTY
uniref:Spalt like transcription factor 1 n=1 Tax=Sus scrofa TaxID=9823 RepID=A0A8W4FMB9_PIG